MYRLTDAYEPHISGEYVSMREWKTDYVFLVRVARFVFPGFFQVVTASKRLSTYFPLNQMHFKEPSAIINTAVSKTCPKCAFFFCFCFDSLCMIQH